MFIRFTQLIFCLISWSIFNSVFAAELLTTRFEKNEISLSAHDIAQTADGAYITVGSLFDAEVGPSSWGWLAKVGSNGTILWQKEFGKKAKNSSFTLVRASTDGNFILGGGVHGFYQSSVEHRSGWLVKIDANGKVLWDKTLNLGDAAEVYDAQVLADGSVLVLLFAKENDHLLSFVIKYDSLGKELFNKKIALPDDLAVNLIRPFADGGFMIAGKKFSLPTSQVKLWMARFDKQGKLLWEKVWSDFPGEALAALVLPNEDILLAGQNTQLANDKLSGLALFKLDKQGREIWQKMNYATDTCAIDTLWLTRDNKTFATGKNCRETSAWIGEIANAGDIRITDSMTSKEKVQLERVLPLGQKYAVIWLDRQSFGVAESVVQIK